MNTYILKVNKGCTKSVGEYYSRQEAYKAMEKFIINANKGLNPDDEKYLMTFDFSLDVVENKGISESIDTFDKACQYLGLDKETDLYSFRKKHEKAVTSFYQLCTIAEAWNKEDDFTPDFSDSSQYKYFPWFEYSRDAAWFVCATTQISAAHASSSFGSRICFKTHERAMQFGKQFIDLWNDILMIK